MSAPPVAGKICIVCGQDCSGKPRTKDQTGRYTCKECFDKLMAVRQSAPTAAAPPAGPAPAARLAPPPTSRPAVPPRPVQTEEAPDDAGVVAALMDEAPGFTDTCPSCGSGMTGGSVICTICGHNKETGQALGVKLLKAPKEKRSGPGLGEMLLNPTYTALGVLAVFAGLFALAFVAPAATLLYIVAASLYSLVCGVLLLVDAFKQGVVPGLLCLFVPIYSLYYLLVRCESAFIKIHCFLSIVVGLGMFGLIAAVGLNLDSPP